MVLRKSFVKTVSWEQ